MDFVLVSCPLKSPKFNSTREQADEGLEADLSLDNMKVYNTAGQLVKSIKDSYTPSEITKQLNSGSYILKSDKGAFKVVK